MLGKIIERINAHIAAYRLKQIPAIRIGRASIMQYWPENFQITKNFDKTVIDSHTHTMMEEVIKVALSPDPRMANREALAGYVLAYAKWQVLVIKPPPKPDVTGLRGKPGITGKLEARLPELAEKDNDLQEYLHQIEGPLSKDNLSILMGRRTYILWTWVQVFSQMRSAFDDFNHAKGKDWIDPFIAAMCASEEYQFRAMLGMPQVLGNSKIDPFIHYMRLSSFLDIVLSGVRYPDLEWQRQKPNGS
jgi:hypothetical protein